MARMEWWDVATRRMKDLGLKQEDFIEPLVVKTRGAVGHYFTGRRTPTPAQFKTIADKLDMSMDQLFTGSPSGRAMQMLEPRSIYNVRPGEVVIPQYAIAGAMGEGIEAQEHPDIVRQVRVVDATRRPFSPRTIPRPPCPIGLFRTPRTPRSRGHSILGDFRMRKSVRYRLLPEILSGYVMY